MSKHVTYLCDQCDTPCDPRACNLVTLARATADGVVIHNLAIDLCDGCYEGARIYFSKSIGKLECTESPQDIA